MKHIKDQRFGEERALYALTDAVVENCRFAGEEDGESALKESREIEVEHCDFELRYPFWHTVGAKLVDVTMHDTCRAALWYARDISILDSRLFGIKALRECEFVHIGATEVKSTEFGWFSNELSFEDSRFEGEYFLLHASNVTLRNVYLKGKYSFQYCKNVTIYDSILDTKDAFWECENITVYNSTVKGEYLGWYAKNLRLVNCHIVGTQPLCYCKGLVLENCTMEDCDLSFEYSEVEADVRGAILSVKNVLSGKVVADSIGEIIFDENRKDDGKAVVSMRA